MWMEDLTTEATRVSVNKKIDNFVEGDLEHATEMLCALWEIANTDGDIKFPLNTLPAVSLFRFWLLLSVIREHSPHITKPRRFTSPTHWGPVKISLIKSMRTGVFFDRKYWARHSKSVDVLKPVYFSSIIMSDRAQELNSCKSKFGCGFAEALRVPSGKIPQGTKRSHELPRGRRQRRQRL
jgi:hypothetical protein